MSFILDALKKSESERQRQAGPALLEARIVRPSRRPPVWAITIGALLLINFGIVAWLLAHSGAGAPAARTSPAAAPAAPITAPATGLLPPAAVSAASAPAGAAPGLSARASRMIPPTAAPAASPAATAGSTAAEAAGAVNPADLEPAVAPPAGSTSGAGNPGLHHYTELAGTLPPLRLDLHVYATNPADRYAFINMRKVREGDLTPEGVRVSQITREGVVLEYRGTEFLLGRE